MEESCGPLAIEIFPGKHCDFSSYFAKRARAHNGACAEVQFPDYGTVLWSPVSRNCSKKHCDFSTYLAKKSRAQSGALQRCSFLIMEQCCGPLVVENFPAKHFDFSPYLAKGARAQSGACAEVQFPDYGTELWSPDS
jgi:hypothetical protein